MVCQTYVLQPGPGGFHKNHGDDENDKDNSDSHKQTRGLSSGLAESTATTEMTKTTGIRGAKLHCKQQVPPCPQKRA